MAPGLFVTGTGTGVGKTVVSAAIAAALHGAGRTVRALKPLLTGLEDPPDPHWPRDHELLAACSGAAPEDVAMLTFDPPVSPHLAAELAGRPIHPAALHAAILRAATGADALIVEGVGGLLVPLADGYDVAVLAATLALPVLIVATPGLGTINHTLLTLEAARHRGLDVVGVVLSGWPDRPGEIERSNRETIARLGRVAVHTLPLLERGDPRLLAAAGATLPVGQWLRQAAASPERAAALPRPAAASPERAAATV